MSDGPSTDWAAARSDWEIANGSRYTIARRHRVTLAELSARAKANKWSDAKWTASTDRIILIERLLGVLERQVEHMETKEMTPTGEKEAAVLGKITATLGTLIKLANAEAHGTTSMLETAEMRDIRQKLAKRINELTKG